jgi:hypothetical protein
MRLSFHIIGCHLDYGNPPVEGLLRSTFRLNRQFDLVERLEVVSAE